MNTLKNPLYVGILYIKCYKKSFWLNSTPHLRSYILNEIGVDLRPLIRINHFVRGKRQRLVS